MNLLREVKEKVDRPFSVKLAETREIIVNHFEEFGDKVAIAFSGGKDSEIVLWLCLQVNPNVPVVFCNTGVEYPETVRFVAQLEDEWGLNIIVTHPIKTFWDCVKQYGFPSPRDKRRCCYWLKEKPMYQQVKSNAYLGTFTGITASESWKRMHHARREGICFHYKHWNICKIHPILWWKQSEVWDFMNQERLPINPIYGLGENRTGCMPCTAHKRWEEIMQKMNPKLYRLIKLRKDNQYVMELL